MFDYLLVHLLFVYPLLLLLLLLLLFTLLFAELGSLEEEIEHYKTESCRLSNQLLNEKVLKQQVNNKFQLEPSDLYNQFGTKLYLVPIGTNLLPLVPYTIGYKEAGGGDSQLWALQSPSGETEGQPGQEDVLRKQATPERAK